MRRLDAGGSAIDRDTPLRFRFDGVEYTGFAGDTLASALLANGVGVVCPSPILGRPRGVMSAGVEEASAFVELTAPFVDPIVAATAVELVEGLKAAGRPGVGRLPGPDAPTPPCEHRYAHVETLVVGGGREGLEAATAAAVGSNDRVLLVEQGAATGGDAHGITIMLRATALGVYDHGFVVIHERSRPVERLWHVRARRVVLATGAHERPIAFADCDRPA